MKLTNCKRCGKGLEGRQRLWCSEDCKSDNDGSRRSGGKCGSCGERLPQGRWKYCSDACRRKMRTRKNPGSKYLRNSWNGEALFPVAPLQAALIQWRDEQPDSDSAGKSYNFTPKKKQERAGRWWPLVCASKVPERRIRSYVTGESPQVSMHSADRLCIAMGLHLSEVYPYEEYPS